MTKAFCNRFSDELINQYDQTGFRCIIKKNCYTKI